MPNQITDSLLEILLNGVENIRRSPNNIAMFHYGRCGSTVLGDLISQHPEIYWDGEVFNKLFRQRLKETKYTKDPYLLLRIRMLRAKRKSKYYGFETKLHPAYDLGKAILNTTSSNHIATLKKLGYTDFIVLKRQNYLRQQVSEEIGRQRGRVWHQPAGVKASLHQVTLDVNCTRFGGYKIPLLTSLEEREKTYLEVEKLLKSNRTLWLTYEEDILPDPKIGYRRVCEFIGVEPVEVTIKKSRINPYPLHETIVNFDEVKNHLQNTPYEWMLAE